MSNIEDQQSPIGGAPSDSNKHRTRNIILVIIFALILVGVVVGGVLGGIQTGDTVTPRIRREKLTKMIQSRSPATSFENETSPQFLALEWMAVNDFETRDLLPEKNSTDRLIQRFALVTLYYATGGPTTWVDDRGWLNIKSRVCEGEWMLTSNNDNDISPVCSSDGLILRLELMNNGLTGSLPRELGLLMSLDVLDLSNNRLTGMLPTELGQLSGIQTLTLNNNQFNGAVPSELESLANNVVSVDIYNNNLVGTWPSVFCDANVSSASVRIDCDEIQCDCCRNETSQICP